MPCIIFDNTDHYSQEFQESVFQYAMALHRKVLSFVICPITDRTIWRLDKYGPLQSYQNIRTFYLPVPSTKEVLAKRVSFIKKKLKLEDNPKEYFVGKGLRLSIEKINGFAASVEDIFINEDYVGRLIGWLSNHDIRRSLMIAQRIITSQIIGIADLISAYIAEERYRPERRRVKRALINGDYNYFEQSESDFILNLFEVDSNAVTTPLLRPSILRLLLDRSNENDAKQEKSYLEVREILNYFEPARLSRSTVESHLNDLLEYRLVEPYDPTDSRIYESQKIKIAPSGRIHYEFMFAENEASYVTQMALTTAVNRQSYVDSVKEILSSPDPLQWKDWQNICGLFIRHCLSQDRQYVSFPTTDAYNGQRAMRIGLERAW